MTLQVTPIHQWKQGEVVQLPSGFVARLKRPDVIELILDDGKVPDVLMPLIFGQQVKPGRQPNTEEITPEMLELLVPTLKKMTKACFVEPRIADTPDENSIGIEDVPFADKLWVFQWAIGGQGQTAAIFPQKSGGNVVTVPTSANGQRKTKQSTRNHG